MPQKIFNPPSQFSRLGIQCPALVFVLVCLVRVRGDLFSFLKFFGWCAIHMYFHVYVYVRFFYTMYMYTCTVYRQLSCPGNSVARTQCVMGSNPVSPFSLKITDCSGCISLLMYRHRTGSNNR